MKSTQAVIMVTRRCNMTCGHCSVESNPLIKLQPAEHELRALVDSLIDSGVKSIQFTGGEPMLRGELVLELMAQAKNRGVPSALTSNGFWGKKSDHALTMLERLQRAGLTRLAVSYDRFHAEFQGTGPVMNILEAARQLDWPIHINITRTLDDRELDQLIEPFRDHPYAQLRFYDIQPVGLAKNLPEELRAEIDGFCSGCAQPTFTDNGRVTACNGPAYFETMDSALIVGEYRSKRTSVPDLLKTHAEDPILETIRVDGPVGLRDALQSLPGFEDYPFKERYSGMCDLCLQLNSDPKVVEALRTHLSRPDQVAARLARKLVLDNAQGQTHHRQAINDREAPASFLKLLTDSSDDEMRKVFGRADLDWAKQVRVLESAGLLHLLDSQKENPFLTAWTPHFFWTSVNQNVGVATMKLQDFREAVQLAEALAREHEFELSPWGATQLAVQQSPRLVEDLEFSTNANPATVQRILQERLDRPVRVRAEQAINLTGNEKTTYQVMSSWWDRGFRGGLEAGWDLFYVVHLSGGFDWSVLEREATRRKQECSLQVCALALQQRFAFDISENLQPSPGPSKLVQKLVRHQMFLDVGVRSNIFIKPLLHLLLRSSWREIGSCGLNALRVFSLDLKLTLARNGARQAWQEIEDDFREALETARFSPRKIARRVEKPVRGNTT